MDKMPQDRIALVAGGAQEFSAAMCWRLDRDEVPAVSGLNLASAEATAAPEPGR